MPNFVSWDMGHPGGPTLLHKLITIETNHRIWVAVNSNNTNSGHRARVLTLDAQKNHLGGGGGGGTGLSDFKYYTPEIQI